MNASTRGTVHKLFSMNYSLINGGTNIRSTQVNRMAEHITSLFILQYAGISIHKLWVIVLRSRRECGINYNVHEQLLHCRTAHKEV